MVNPIVAYHVPRDDFNKVVCNRGTRDEDYWYIWEDDYEPVRISYAMGAIFQALHRKHWAHKIITNPYKDNQQRIHVFFHWHAHTPKVKKEDDRIFEALIQSYRASKKEQYAMGTDPIPAYYTSPGRKDRHWPPVNYEGWPNLV